MKDVGTTSRDIDHPPFYPHCVNPCLRGHNRELEVKMAVAVSLQGYHVTNDMFSDPSNIYFYWQHNLLLTTDYQNIVTFVSKGRAPMRSTGSVEQPFELLSGLTYYSICPINLSLVATLELTLYHPLPLRWRRLIHVSNQRNGVRPPLQRPVVLAIVTFVLKGRVPMRSTGSVEQPLELLSGLAY